MVESALESAARNISTFTMSQLSLLRDLEEQRTPMETDSEVTDALLIISNTLFARVRALLDSEVLKLRHHRNALQAINRLPDDLFAYLLEHCLIPSNDPDEHDVMARLRLRGCLALVSTDWYNFMNRTPALWRVCSPKAPRRINELSIKKSRNCPLICMDWNRYRDQSEIPWELGEEDFQRCQKLQASAMSPATLALIQKGNPLLQKLSLFCVGSDWSTFQPAPGCFPNLVSLTLKYLYVEWAITPFSSLVTITFFAVLDLDRSLCMALLRANPSLVKLSFVAVEFGGLPDQDNTKIPLTQLKELTLEFYTTHGLEFLVTSIEGPSLERMLLSVEIDTGEDILPDPPLYVINSLFTTSRRNSVLRIELFDSTPAVRIDQSSGSVRLRGNNLDSTVNWLVRNLNQCDFDFLVELVISLSDLAVLNRLDLLFRPCRSRLHIKIQPLVMLTLWLQEICNRCKDSTWPFPRLEALTLSLSKPRMDNVVRLLRQRYTGDSGAAPIRSLVYRVREPLPEFMSMLQRIPSFESCRISEEEDPGAGGYESDT